MRPNPGLYEFLQESELIHYYTAFKNILQVHNVGQLKYVTDDDLSNIGMSRPECRRLKTFFNKYCPVNYATKLRRLLGRKEEGKEECLLGEEMNTSKGAIKVPSQHVIHADSIVVYKELGEGEFGIVQQGVWTDDDGMRHQVAVKCLSKKRMQNNTVEFMKEYDIMQTIDHNNIVRLYGVVLDSAHHAHHRAGPAQISTGMPQGDEPADDLHDGVPGGVLSADLLRHDVPREQAPHPQRPRRPEHPRLLKESRQNLGLWVVPGPGGREGLLPDELQREPEAADRVVRT